MKKLDEKLYEKLLSEKDISQKDLAKRLKINEKTFSAYLKYAKFKPVEQEKIAAYLGTSIEFLWPEYEESTDYQAMYEELLRDHTEMLKEYNKCLKSNSGEIAVKVEANQKLIANLYAQLKIPYPDIGKDIALNGK